ncbi:MAG: c-type cytochrome [Flavipsychrobacter sp.]|nr:c-type cytochrome [Flavipsychrobacter sp.]
MYPFIKKNLLFLLLLVPLVGQAAATAPAKDGGSLNVLLISLVSLIIVFLFVIGAAANVLRQLSQALIEKNDAATPDNTGSVKSLLLLLIASGLSFSATAAGEAEAVAYVSWKDKVVSGIPAFDFYMIMGILVLELLVIFAMLVYIRILVRVLSGQPETEKQARRIIKVNFWDRVNKVVPIEREADVMLDHDYDGIHELDNSLPPWWKYGFYLTIVVGVIYLWRFHVSGTGPSSYQEYVAEVKQGEADKAAYLAQSANNVDENSITLLTDDGSLASGKKIFETSCAACHAADGGGGVGPNLADDYWLHGGSIQDIFKSVKYGWQDKGMKSWKDDFSPKQIAELSSYVKTLQGTKPAAPKEPQGEKYTEQQAAPADSAQSVAQK